MLELNKNPCKMCFVLGLKVCKGHGGGSGGGSGGSGGGSSSSSENSTQGEVLNQSAGSSALPTSVPVQGFENTQASFVESLLTDNDITSYEAGLLNIEGNKLYRTLVFQVQPELSKEENALAKLYFDVVKQEFDNFKDQLLLDGVSTKGFTSELKNNTLTICIPNPTYYTAFIQLLKKDNYLPLPDPTQLNKEKTPTDTYQQGRNTPSPFGDISKGPKPSGVI